MQDGYVVKEDDFDVGGIRIWMWHAQRATGLCLDNSGYVQWVVYVTWFACHAPSMLFFSDDQFIYSGTAYIEV